jgi:fumarylacetoacetate (FAA) hydrolase
MKLATFKDGSRDGQLVVVSRDLATAHFATGIASRLQQVLDDWNFLSPQLQDLYVTLNQGKARHAFEFVPAMCMAPLPRAYRWAFEAQGHAMVHGAGDALLGPHEDMVGSDVDDIGFEARIAAITGDVPRGATPDQALDGIRLLLLANRWHLRAAEPPSAFSPVAATPEEPGDAWRGGQVHLPLQVQRNGAPVPINLAEVGAQPFGPLVAALAAAAPVRAGSIVAAGALATTAIQPGDRVAIEMPGRDGQSLFGAIEQKAVAAR